MQKTSNDLVDEASIIEESILEERKSSDAQIKNFIKFATLLSKHFQASSSQLNTLSTDFFDNLGRDLPEHIKDDLDWLETILNQGVDRFKLISKDIAELVILPIDLSVPGLASLHEDLKERASLLTRMIDSSVNPVSRSPPKGYLGYEGLIMTRRRSGTSLDITNHQRKCAELMKQVDVVYSSKCKTFRAACQHLSSVLNRVVNNKEVDEFLNRQTSLQNVRSKQEADALSPLIIKNLKERMGEDVRLTQLVNDSAKAESNDPQQLLTEIRIKKYVENLLGINKSSDPNIRLLILEDAENIQKFLGLLNYNVKNQIEIQTIDFEELNSIFKSILAMAFEQEDNQELIHHVLVVSLRIYCRQRPLIADLGKEEEYWRSADNWVSIYQYLKAQILKHKAETKNPPGKSPKTPTARDLFNGGLRKLLNMMGNEVSKLETEEEVSLEIIREINQLICELQVPNDDAINIITTLCKSQKVKQTYLEDFLKAQQNYVKQHLRRNYLCHSKKKQRREQRQSHVDFNRTTRAIKHVLRYLTRKDHIEILAVSKAWKEELENGVYKANLVFVGDLKEVCKFRIQLYKHILGSRYTKKEYEHLKTQVPVNFPSSEVIDQDVNRSLKWAINLQPLLYEILVTYSVHHPETKYVQGMHYLCEHLLHISTEPWEVYGMMESLMKNHFLDIFTATFEILKLRIFQFSRVLEIYYPRLAEHFAKENLEAEHFILPWAVTLWGDKQGEMVDVLWDGFLVDGWKWWIKVSIWIVSLYEKELLLMNFDAILMHMNTTIEQQILNATLEEIPKAPTNKDKIKKQIDAIRVTDRMLKEIQKEFSYSDFKLMPILTGKLTR